MTDPSAPADRLRAILVVAATAATLAFNFFAATGLVNGVRPQDVSNKYFTPVTPAGYAFSIWSVIYVGLAAFCIYQLLPANWARFKRIRTLYIVTCVLNIGWIYFWHHEQILVCFVMILLLCVALYRINTILLETGGTKEFWLVKAPFSLYFGWVTAATLVNFAIMLVYLEAPLSPSAWTSISVILILLAAASGVWTRIKLSNYLHPLAIAWALTAIAVKQSAQTLIVAACAIGVVACLIAACSFVVKLPTRSTTHSAAK